MPINTGDTAWILISSAMVLLMTPGLAFFYGGMARRKNLLSTIMMSFSMMCLIGVLWILWGYSIGFGDDISGLFGSLNFFGLKNVGLLPSSVYATTVPHMAFMTFQGMFAIITVALISGAVVERIKFSALIVFSALWVTLVYCPVAHWIWGDGGWLANLGVVDFAGGAVVHINAGVSALALVLLLGKRKGFPSTSMTANSIPLVAIGTGLLWFGWFGFNAGSALAANEIAVNAFVATNASGAAAGLTWMIISWLFRRPSLLGTLTGAVAGLAAVTPAAGFITPMAAIVVGVVVSIISYFAVILIKEKLGFDDSLDVFAVHGIGGIWGTLATGIFATASISGVSGLIEGNVRQFGVQALATVVVVVFAFVATWIIGKLVDKTIGLRVTKEEETLGLDIAQHGERAYGGLVR